MKKSFVKIITLCLAVMMMVSCFAGCRYFRGKSSMDDTGAVTVWAFEADWVANKEAGQAILDYMASLTGLDIEWASIGTKDQFALQVASGSHPAVIMGNRLSGVEVVKYAETGIVIPIDEYITKDNTPNLYKLFEEYPSVKALITMDDGHIYSLPSINDWVPGANESMYFINKAWLDKLDLEVPKTLDDLYEVLKAFKTGDPNGNGKADEIPMSWNNGAGYSYPEFLLSAWGFSAKHGTWDQFLAIKDGEVVFAPTTKEWKEMIKYYNKLYSEGLLDAEAVTQDQTAFDAKVQSAVPRVGIFTSDSNYTGSDEYVCIPPLSVDGKVKPKVHIHPSGFTYAAANVFEITNNCQDPEAVMRWIDNFYDVKTSAQINNGMIGYTFTEDENGMLKYNKPEKGETQQQMINKNHSIAMVGLTRTDAFGKEIEMSEVQKEKEANFKIYEEYVDDEIWPRPYYSTEDAERVSSLTVNLFRLVEEKKAKWIMGTADIDKEWESYKKDLDKMGLDELIEISQKAYDLYLENMK